MMKLRITLVISLILTAMSAWAAKPVVDRAVEQIKSAPSLTATFRVNGTPGTLTMSGECFTLELPDMHTAFNGTTQWTLNVPDRELTLTTPTPEEIAVINPLGFIGTLRSQFVTSTLPDGRVRFTPATRVSDVTEIVAQFDNRTALPVRVTMKTSAGEMLIDGIKVTRGTKAIPAARFNIKAPKGVETIDLR